jgi:uncharacterized RDD family membrane protein YckC
MNQTAETTALEQTENEDVLSDLFPENEWIQASLGQRFGNYLLDIVGFVAFLFVIGFMMGLLGMWEAIEFIDQNENTFYEYMINAVMYVTYMTLVEGLTKGRSLGKLITGTRVVTEDGESIGFSKALVRSLSRIVPFEVFSAFGDRPWHDSWTNTYVVKNQPE